jgi:hypothetical protein
MMLGCGREVELKRGKEWAGYFWGILEGSSYHIHDIANETPV